MVELCFNLWAVFDSETGLIYALTGKAYSIGGKEHNKLAVLKALSKTDHVTVKRYGLSDRFRVSYLDGTVKTCVAYLNAVNDPNANIFEEIFLTIEAELPPLLANTGGEFVEIKQAIPENPVCVVTVLYEDEKGKITPIVSDADREWIQQQEQMRGRG